MYAFIGVALFFYPLIDSVVIRGLRVANRRFGLRTTFRRSNIRYASFCSPGARFSKSRELFGPEKPFVKVRPAYFSVKLVFSCVVKGIKIKITAKFRASRRLSFEDTKRIMSPEMRPRSFRTFEKQAPGARFSKVPKLFGSISGATIPFISSQRRGSKPSNFAILLVFLTLKTCKKISFSKQADCSLTTSFSGPKSSRDFRETGPWPEFLEAWLALTSVNYRRNVYVSITDLKKGLDRPSIVSFLKPEIYGGHLGALYR